MYLWKSWHDSRQRLAVYAGACLAIGIIVGLENIYWFRAMWGWRAIATHLQHYHWNRNLIYVRPANLYYQFMPLVGLWSALVFGAISVGREYGSGAMSFVLTRPQSRWLVVWYQWALALAEIFIILGAFFIGALPFLVYFSKYYVGFDATLIPGVLVVAACLCGLTQFLTLLTGSSMKGMSASVAVALFYYFLPSALDVWWHIHWPEKVQDLSLSVLGMYMPWNRSRLPIVEVTAIWMLVALIFPFLSQWLIEKREI